MDVVLSMGMVLMQLQELLIVVVDGFDSFGDTFETSLFQQELQRISSRTVHDSDNAGPSVEVHRGTYQGGTVILKRYSEYRRSNDTALHPDRMLALPNKWDIPLVHHRHRGFLPYTSQQYAQLGSSHILEVNRSKMIRGVAEGLVYLHDNGIVHCDLTACDTLVDDTVSSVLADLCCDFRVQACTFPQTSRPSMIRSISHDDIKIDQQSTGKQPIYPPTASDEEAFGLSMISTGHEPPHETPRSSAPCHTSSESTHEERPPTGVGGGRRRAPCFEQQDFWIPNRPIFNSFLPAVSQRNVGTGRCDSRTWAGRYHSKSPTSGEEARDGGEPEVENLWKLWCPSTLQIDGHQSGLGTHSELNPGSCTERFCRKPLMDGEETSEEGEQDNLGKPCPSTLQIDGHRESLGTRNRLDSWSFPERVRRKWLIAGEELSDQENLGKPCPSTLQIDDHQGSLRTRRLDPSSYFWKSRMDGEGCSGEAEGEDVGNMDEPCSKYIFVSHVERERCVNTHA